jgi:hypothetical protein
MMKNIILLTLVILLAGNAGINAQGPLPTADEASQFLKSKTYVVLENSPFSLYNPAVKEAVNSYWTITPFEFIGIDEFNKLRQDPMHSFLVLTETDYERDKSGSTFAFINLLMGKKVRGLEEMPEFCAIPLDFAGEDADAEYGYKLGIILRFIQQHAQVIINNPKTPGIRFLKYYNQFVPEISEKTILARAGDMEEALSDEEAIGKIYPYPFKIVDEEAIKEAISEKRPNTLILHKVGPPEDITGAFVFKMLIGTDDARMYYFNNHKIDARNANGFITADMRRIGRF